MKRGSCQDHFQAIRLILEPHTRVKNLEKVEKRKSAVAAWGLFGLISAYSNPYFGLFRLIQSLFWLIQSLFRLISSLFHPYSGLFRLICLEKN